VAKLREKREDRQDRQRFTMTIFRELDDLAVWRCRRNQDPRCSMYELEHLEHLE
jgi:hypothetical protein